MLIRLFLVLVAIGVTAGPLAADEVTCAECDETFYEGEWWHKFTSGDGCDEEGLAPTCASCGGTSECHYDEWQKGKCHVGCEPTLALVREVDELLRGYASGDSSPTVAGSSLASVVLRSNRITVTEQGRRLILKDCRGMINRMWEIDNRIAVSDHIQVVSRLRPASTARETV